MVLSIFFSMMLLRFELFLMMLLLRFDESFSTMSHRFDKLAARARSKRFLRTNWMGGARSNVCALHLLDKSEGTDCDRDNRRVDGGCISALSEWIEWRVELKGSCAGILNVLGMGRLVTLYCWIGMVKNLPRQDKQDFPRPCGNRL
jgi:hypothetical protein